MAVNDLSTFNNTNLLVVVLLLMVMCYCRVIGEFLMNNCILWEEFLTHRCLKVCCGCDNVGALQILRGALILYTFSLPVFFCAAHVYRTYNKVGMLSLRFMPQTPFVNRCIVEASINSTNATSVWSLHKVHDDELADMLASCYAHYSQKIYSLSFSIDPIYVILPMSFASSINCLTWVNLIKSNHITDTTLWDENLDEQVLAYEVTFLIECFFSNFALVLVASSGNFLLDLLVLICLVGAIECFFVQIAKVSEHSLFNTCLAVSIQMVMCCVFFLYIPFIVISSLDNSNAIVLMAVFVLRFVFNTTLHYAAHGEVKAGYVILFRLLNVLLVSGTLLVFYVTAN